MKDIYLAILILAIILISTGLIMVAYNEYDLSKMKAGYHWVPAVRGHWAPNEDKTDKREKDDKKKLKQISIEISNRMEAVMRTDGLWNSVGHDDLWDHEKCAELIYPILAKALKNERKR